MENINLHLKNICKSSDPASERIVMAIVRERNATKYKAEQFSYLSSEIWNLLQSKDCKVVSNLLILLQSICEEAKADAAHILLAVRDHNFESISNHPPDEMCKLCDIVKLTTAYLSGLVTWIICSDCRKLPAFYTQLTCHHLVCKSCWIRAKYDINKSSYGKSKEVFCPICNTPTKSKLLCALKDSDLIEMKQQLPVAALPASSTQKTSNSESWGDNPMEELLEMTCPKCKILKLCQTRDGILAQCSQCDYCFCSNCLQDFHGPTECEGITPPTAIEGDCTGQRKNSTKEEIRDSSYGPVAMEFENDFYANLRVFTSEEVNEAFQHAPTDAGHDQTKNWPWTFDIKCDLWRSRPEYRSLQPGNWVEDDILEKCIDVLMEQSNIKDSHAFLESYVMKYAAIKGGDDSVLQRILSEKKILQKRLALVLINSDLGGQGGHWILGVIHLQDQRIILLDSSLVLSPAFYRKSFFVVLRILYIAYQLEHKVFEPKDWKLIVGLDTVQQQNGYDCGPIVVCNAYAVMQNAILSAQPETRMVRQWMLYTLETNADKHKGSPDPKKKNLGNSDHATLPVNTKVDNFKPAAQWGCYGGS